MVERSFSRVRFSRHRHQSGPTMHRVILVAVDTLLRIDIRDLPSQSLANILYTHRDKLGLTPMYTTPSVVVRYEGQPCCRRLRDLIMEDLNTRKTVSRGTISEVTSIIDRHYSSFVNNFFICPPSLRFLFFFAVLCVASEEFSRSASAKKKRRFVLRASKAPTM